MAKLRSLFANKRAEEDLAREVASHLTLLADDFEHRGVSHEEAELAALFRFGFARNERPPWIKKQGGRS